jgi:DNA (cytosine-5)-methyltransferase 1
VKYLSTFTGIGGFEYGINKAWEHKPVTTGDVGRLVQLRGNIADADSRRNERRESDSASCIGYSEINEPAIKTYEEHYDHHNYGDITAIEPAGLPDFDLIVGGFPCQAFSVAGKRLGFDEARGTLFFDLARILKDKRPGHLVFENVKGLLNHDGGKTFTVILGILADLGYSVEWQVLNSKNFGVPQNRERIYIVGHLGNRCTRKIFPLGAEDSGTTDTGEHASSGTERFIKTRHLSQNGGLVSDSMTLQASEIPHIIEPRVIQIANLLETPHNSQSGRIYDKAGISPTLDVMGGGNRQPKIQVREATKQGYATATVGDGINLGAARSTTRRARVAKQTANTLDTAGQIGTYDGTRIRRLTPVECERLQGFPDNWTIGSDTQRYKQCGNAVTTNVVEAVMTALMPCLT